MLQLMLINHQNSYILALKLNWGLYLRTCGLGISSGKVFDYGLGGPGSILGVAVMEIFHHSLSRLIMESTEPHIKLVPGVFPRSKGS